MDNSTIESLVNEIRDEVQEIVAESIRELEQEVQAVDSELA